MRHSFTTLIAIRSNRSSIFSLLMLFIPTENGARSERNRFALCSQDELAWGHALRDIFIPDCCSRLTRSEPPTAPAFAPLSPSMDRRRSGRQSHTWCRIFAMITYWIQAANGSLLAVLSREYLYVRRTPDRSAS